MQRKRDQIQVKNVKINHSQLQDLFAVPERKLPTRQWVWSQLKLLKIVKYLKLWKCCLQYNPISIMSSALNRQRAGTLSSWFNPLWTIQILTLTKKSYYQISLLQEVLFPTRLLGWSSGGDLHILFYIGNLVNSFRDIQIRVL